MVAIVGSNPKIEVEQSLIVKPEIEDEKSSSPKLVGILKPPSASVKLRSFPSLPETFMNQLGLSHRVGLR